jgi:hypothetical protein
MDMEIEIACNTNLEIEPSRIWLAKQTVVI